MREKEHTPLSPLKRGIRKVDSKNLSVLPPLKRGNKKSGFKNVSKLHFFISRKRNCV